MFKYQGITFGADPELFLRSRKTGKVVPACGLIGGTKEKPKKIDRLGHAIQEDNVMVEFNIPPVVNAQQLHFSITRVLEHLEKKLPQFHLAIEASASFDWDDLQSEQAQRFGCDPDYDAWNIRINNPPAANTNIRTCGGHIHVGYKSPDMENQIALVKAMDLFLGVPSIVLDPDKVRKQRYGKAGAFRPKEYGIEWRVASNFWIKTVELREWAFRNTHKAAKWLNSGEQMTKVLGTTIQQIINTGDEKKADLLCNKFGLLEGM